MSVFKRVPIKKEFLNFLRNNDIFSIPTRNVTTKTDTGTTSETGPETITLSETGVKNVRSIEYDGVTLNFGFEYTIDINNNQVTLLSITPGKTYSITFDYSSSGDSIYSDYPRIDLTMNSYPRMGFDIYGQTSRIGAFGNLNFIEFRFNIEIYTKKREELEEYIDELRDKVINSQTSLYNVSYIKPQNTSQIQEVQGKHGRLFKITFDVESKNNMEAN